jgi:hypothetical protein
LKFSAGRTAPVPGAAILGVILLGAAGLASADDFIVYSPYVIAGQSEIETRGYHYTDSRAGFGGSAAEMSIAHGVNDWWKPEFYVLEYLQSPGSRAALQGYEFENTFQLTPPGKYFLDVGFLAAFEHNIVAGVPDAAEFGPLLEFTSGRIAHIVNLIWEKQVGAGADGKYALRYSYSGTYALSQALRPGLEAYVRPADRAYQAGPILAGEFHLPGTTSNLEYRVGVVLGINSDAPRQTWMARFEYEFY